MKRTEIALHCSHSREVYDNMHLQKWEIFLSGRISGIRRMGRIYITFSLLCFMAGIGAAQKSGRYTVSGVILDAGTREPLPIVNVFLANTALGAVTDTSGRFSIPNIPTGAYDLIISIPGFEREIRRIEVQQKNLTTIRILLKEKLIEAGPVEIVGEEPSVWKERLEVFTQNFFGETQNGKKCVILNPEVLEFTVNEETERFEAASESPILIQNNALGYRMEFLMRFFIRDGRLLRVGGWTKFIELTPKDDAEKEYWIKERERAYRGSLRHFLASLVNDRLEEEGFRISLVKDISTSTRTSLLPDHELKQAILRLGRLSFERELSFKDYLKVEYLHAFQEAGFEKYWRRIMDGAAGWEDHHQFSWLQLSVRPIVMNADGLPYDSSLLQTYGYWAFERLAEWLPLEYALTSD
jgi:hypothetical protein